MFGLPLLTVLALAFVVWRFLTYFKKKSHEEQALEKSLEDETIYVEGLGQVAVEDLNLNATPEDAKSLPTKEYEPPANSEKSKILKKDSNER
ncbi:hypothetical protein CNR22_17800 [Sphingobacteriaceae bacterium]|nr:hypothetical protein CNR22_17800 [Sphingobacteriaceae bacterium]